MKNLTTLPEVVAHLESVKAKMDAFNAENPDIPFGTYFVKDLHPALIYEIKDYVKSKQNLDRNEITVTGNKLTLFSYIEAFGFTVLFNSVPIEVTTPALANIKILEEVA